MDLVQEIIKLYSEINKIYIELYKLEGSFGKDSKRFRELLSLLKSKLDEEKKLYDTIFLEYGGEYEDLYKLIDNITDKPFGIRMRDYVSLQESNDVRIYEGEYDDVIDEILSDIKYSKLYDACSKNIFLVYLSFLQEYADMDSFRYLKERILSFKYYNAFINHEIENILIESSFDVDRVNYVNIDFVADMLKLEECDQIILDCLMDTITTTIEQLLSINDIDYSDDGKMAIALNNQSMLRASLSLIKESDYNKIKDSLFSEIKKLCNNYNSISMGMIKSLIDGRKKDKSRVRRISMRPIDE